MGVVSLSVRGGEGGGGKTVAVEVALVVATALVNDDAEAAVLQTMMILC